MGIWSDDLSIQYIGYLPVIWFMQDALRLYLINSPVVRAESLNFKEEGVYAVVSVLFLSKPMDWNFVILYIWFLFLFFVKNANLFIWWKVLILV